VRGIWLGRAVHEPGALDRAVYEAVVDAPHQPVIPPGKNAGPRVPAGCVAMIGSSHKITEFV